MSEIFLAKIRKIIGSITNVIKKMIRSCQDAFIVIFDNADFVIVFCPIHGRKMGFSAVSRNFISEKSIFVHYVVIFLNV